MANDWKWNAMESLEDIVFPSVQAVAVYQNASRDIVIRQEGVMGEDDSVIIIPRQHASALLDAIKAATYTEL